MVSIGAVLAGLVPSIAQASNSDKARVPPAFLGAACIETVDRSVSPVWQFDVGIGLEDVGLTEDEPPDSRTFQFFGLCRQLGPLEALPLWVDVADAMAAAELDPAVLIPGRGQTLADHQEWSTCAQWMTPIEDRIPISCDATQGGATWDTTGVPAGAYAVWGYTYEPVENLWTPRDGVVRVIDGDDASAGPAVSFSWPLTEVDAGLDAGIRVAGCVAGMEGTTLELSWATAGDLTFDGDAAWQTFAQEDDPGETFDIAMLPPPEAEYEAIFFRAVATDPQGRSFAAYTRERVVFLAGCAEPQGGALALPDVCGVGSVSPPVPEGDRSGGGCEGMGSGTADDTGGEPPGTTSTGGASGDSGTTAAADDGGGEPGCGCRANPEPRASLLLLSLLGLGRRRR